MDALITGFFNTRTLGNVDQMPIRNRNQPRTSLGKNLVLVRANVRPLLALSTALIRVKGLGAYPITARCKLLHLAYPLRWKLIALALLRLGIEHNQGDLAYYIRTQCEGLSCNTEAIKCTRQTKSNNTESPVYIDIPIRISLTL